MNLGLNAIEFTGSGGRVSIGCDERADDVLVRVSDTGMGIAADQIETIFEPSVQVDTGLTRRHSGMGLGLTISRAFACGMKGDLQVESEPGRGTAFTLCMPCAPHGVARQAKQKYNSGAQHFAEGTRWRTRKNL